MSNKFYVQVVTFSAKSVKCDALMCVASFAATPTSLKPLIADTDNPHPLPHNLNHAADIFSPLDLVYIVTVSEVSEVLRFGTVTFLIDIPLSSQVSL
jgi:hypothetical protein